MSITMTQGQLINPESLESKIVGQCPSIQQLRQRILELAPIDIPIMIYGDTGVGKELVARSLHQYSGNKNAPFVALNCAAIPDQLAEAELFGYEKGAFTDAVTSRVGKLQHANGGVLFLDEIESLPLVIQAKLLRALSDGKITPLGSNTEIAIDCRVISATKDELRDNKNFRQDLFFRLQVAQFRIPPLKDRGKDIITLFEYFTRQQCEHFGAKYSKTDKKTQEILLFHAWPGNVRELINVATRYAISGCSKIEAAMETDVQNTFDIVSGDSLKDMVQSFEEKLIRSKLVQYKGKVSSVLQDLCIERRTFNKKLKRYGISTPDYRVSSK